MARKKSLKASSFFQTVDPNISLAVLVVGILAIIFALYLVSRPAPVSNMNQFDTSVDQSSASQEQAIDDPEGAEAQSTEDETDIPDSSDDY